MFFGPAFKSSFIQRISAHGELAGKLTLNIEERISRCVHERAGDEHEPAVSAYDL